MRSYIITIEGTPQSHATEVAKHLSEISTYPVYTLEALRAAAICGKQAHCDPLLQDHSTFLSALYALSVHQGTFTGSQSLAQKEATLAKRLLRQGTYILAGASLSTLSTQGIAKVETFLHTKGGAASEAIRFADPAHQGMGYDLILDSGQMGIAQCAEFIYQYASSQHDSDHPN